MSGILGQCDRNCNEYIGSVYGCTKEGHLFCPFSSFGEVTPELCLEGPACGH